MDARSSHELNQRYGVRKTPTLMIFRDGKQVKSAYEDLQGYRSAPVLVPFLSKHVGADITSVASADEMHSRKTKEPVMHSTSLTRLASHHRAAAYLRLP